MIKVRNNENEIIEVTQIAWEVLYKDREGFSLYVEEKAENVTVKEPAKSTKKPLPKKKKVTKDDKSE